MLNKVGLKGQVVIEKELRNRLGVEPGWLALQYLSGDHIEVYFVPPKHRRSLKGSLSGHTKVSVSPKEWPKVVDKAWATAAKRKMKPSERES